MNYRKKMKMKEMMDPLGPFLRYLDNKLLI
jgi:hypothetical protein